jgi:hypothetical protein
MKRIWLSEINRKALDDLIETKDTRSCCPKRKGSPRKAARFQKFDESISHSWSKTKPLVHRRATSNKLVSRDTAEESETGGRSSGRASSASHSRAPSASASQADEEELEASTDLDVDADADEELEEDLDVSGQSSCPTDNMLQYLQ